MNFFDKIREIITEEVSKLVSEKTAQPILPGAEDTMSVADTMDSFGKPTSFKSGDFTVDVAVGKLNTIGVFLFDKEGDELAFLHVFPKNLANDIPGVAGIQPILNFVMSHLRVMSVSEGVISEVLKFVSDAASALRR